MTNENVFNGFIEGDPDWEFLKHTDDFIQRRKKLSSDSHHEHVDVDYE